MGFTTINNELLDNENLNIQEQSLLLAIISFSGKGNANPSYKSLKLRSKIKKDETLIKTIKALIEKELIEVNTALGKRNNYILTPKTEYLRKWSTSENGGTPTPKTEEVPTPKTEYKKEIQKEKEKENIYSHSENDKNEDKYLEIFNHWNKRHSERGIAKAVKLTIEIKKGIDNALKIKKDDESKMAIGDIKQAISNYAEVYNLGLFTYQWRLVDFLRRKQKDTGMPQLLLFLDNGTTYVNCKARLNKSITSSRFIEKKDKKPSKLLGWD